MLLLFTILTLHLMDNAPRVACPGLDGRDRGLLALVIDSTAELITRCYMISVANVVHSTHAHTVVCLSMHSTHTY